MFVDTFNIKHIYGNSILNEVSINDINIIDIREPFELKICSIPNSLFIPMRDLLTKTSHYINKAETYYIICHTGQRSYYVCDELTKQGYNVINIVGGIQSIDEFNVAY